MCGAMSTLRHVARIAAHTAGGLTAEFAYPIFLAFFDALGTSQHEGYEPITHPKD